MENQEEENQDNSDVPRVNYLQLYFFVPTHPIWINIFSSI